ncbi:MAG TPA: choice-of-anchor D domain-containing protein, partial [Candidatus Kapabacteria bacterium]|nr:choice-of-anchor D domain-containing protein [Candidatus Kapabacteria bacterium]
SLDFGANSICGGDSLRTLTITNNGCYPMNLNLLSVSALPFSLVSSFSPAIIDPGISRKYLLRFKPTQGGSSSGYAVIQIGAVFDTIVLTGEGISGSRGYKLLKSVLTTTTCDSAEGDLILRNISCKPLRLDSLDIPPPFALDKFSLPLTIPIDSAIIIHYHFKSAVPGTFTKTLSVHSTYVTEPFDTTFSITAITTEGTPSIQYSPTSLAFDTTSICFTKELEVTIVSTGCDTLEIPIDSLLDSSIFHIVSDVSKRMVLQGDSVKIGVQFHPPGIGTFNTVLHLNTNTGNVDIPIVAYGSNDAGALAVTPVTLGSVLTCKDTTFSFSISNTTCDSVTVDSVIIKGVGQSDYSTAPIIPFKLYSGDDHTFTAIFTPQVGGLRDAVIHIYVHRADGTVVDFPITLQGSGIAPVPIRLTLPNLSFNGRAGSTISVPISLLDASIVPVSRIEFIIRLNLDLLDVTAFDPTGSALTGAIFQPLQFGDDSVIIVIDFPTPTKLDTGLIGTLICKAYLTDTSFSTIEPLAFKIFDAANTADCLPAALVSPPQSITTFTLDSQCGTTTISNYLKYGAASISINGIVPNPTRSEITIDIAFNPIPNSDLHIEVFDNAGVLQQEEVIPKAQLKNLFQHTMSVTGASGSRTLRLSTGDSESRGRFLLVR